MPTTYIGRAHVVALVTDVTGRTREAAVQPGDGHQWFNCPFCSYAVYAAAAPKEDPGVLGTYGNCNNPWCVANPAMPLDKAAGIIRAQDVAEADKLQRERNHLAAMRRIAEDREARKAQDLRTVTEANQRGACVVCALKTGKFIKHRNGCTRRTS